MGTFSALLALRAGHSPLTGEFPAQRPVTRSFVVFVDLCLNKRLSKQSWGWWFETPSRSLGRHGNVLHTLVKSWSTSGASYFARYSSPKYSLNYGSKHMSFWGLVSQKQLSRAETNHIPQSWWRREMEALSALLALCEGNPLVTGVFPHKEQWCGALMFPLMSGCANGCTNNQEAGE